MTAFPRKAVAVFGLTLLVQGIHMIEHFAQLYQYVVLRLPVFESHGIVFFLDLEWNHFIFNAVYVALLWYVFVALGFHKRETYAGMGRFPRHAFIAGLLVQTYHVFEHATRIGQFIQTGCTPCKGVLGWVVNGIYLHFVLNSVTWVLPMIPFFAYGFWRMIRNREPIAPNLPYKTN